MIELATPPATAREELAPDPEFRVEPQDQLRFVPSTIEVFRSDDTTEVHWSPTPTSAVTVPAMSLLEQMVVRARKDVLRHPTSVRYLVNLGTSLLNAGYLDEAAIEFERARSLGSHDISAIAHLARVRLLQARYDEAQELAAQLRASAPTDALGPILLASIALSRMEIQGALAALRDAARLSPHDTLPEYLTGLVMIGERRPSEAIAHLRKAARLDPRSAAIQHALGVALGIKGDWSRATRAFKTALTLAPRQRQSILALSRTLMHCAEIDQAIATLASWVGSTPSDREAQELLAHAYRTGGDSRSARRHLLVALKSPDLKTEVARADRARLMNNIGVCSGDIADHEDAKAWFEKSVQEHATSISTLNLGRCYRELGHTEAAYELLTSWLTQSPTDAGARLLLGTVAAELGRPDEAIDTLEGLIRSGETGPAPYASLGWVLSDERHDYDAALRVLEEGRRRFPKDLAIANNLAYVALMSGRLDLARNVFESVPDSEVRKSAYLTATLGLLRLREGATDAARELYEAAEAIARDQGSKALAKAVRQKMHLEFARGLLESGDRAAALVHTRLGLEVRGRRTFHAELKETHQRLLQLPGFRPGDGA